MKLPFIAKSLVLSLPLSLAAKDSTIQLDDFQVTSQRSFNGVSNEGGNYSINADAILSYNLQDLSQVLTTTPSMRAYRRTAAKSAHPTTQGLCFRNTGVSATSRALVLLSGVPQNDPFGGWIFWNRYHIDAIDSVNISATGDNELWGNLGAGGLITLNPSESQLGRQSLSASVGSDSSYSFALGRNVKLNESSNIDIDARIFDSGGFEVIHPDQQGSLDQEAKSESQAIRAQYNLDTKSGWAISGAIDYFQEERNNGTPLANNETEALDIAFSAGKIIDDSSQLNITAYYQDRSYENQFTSVDDERASEIVALDQFDVPATAYGSSITYAKTVSERYSFLTGVDARAIDGEVNERYRNLGAGLTRQRQAGGEQFFLGIFAAAQYKFSDSTEASISTRVDHIDQTDGMRVEIDSDSKEVLRDDVFEDRDDTEVSINASLTHYLNETQSISATVFRGFRAPTLNELYRPFRVKNDIVEANTDLVNEEQIGFQLSYDAVINNSVSIGVRGFHYQLNDMIANVLVTTDVGFDPLFGFIPEGGSGSQRMNIDESTVTGFEIELNANLTESLAATVNYTYAPTKVEESNQSDNVVGNAFPQSPDNRLYAELNWQVTNNTQAWVSTSVWDDQFDDLGNTRNLDSGYSIDLGLNWAVNDSSRISLRVENATDATIEAGITTGGLVSISAPRTAWITYSLRN
ncbi:TonB-dependent receptor [Puniceicoccaceae bacterium K14]|nr:TonB-dependent receptor [Puniceicoccaceae bacterium K14]